MLTLRSDLEEKLALDIGNSFTCSVYRLCKTIGELNAGFPPPQAATYSIYRSRRASPAHNDFSAKNLLCGHVF
jgi:hypothetical protein